MQTTDFYTTILGLDGNWCVAGVEMDKTQVTIEVEFVGAFQCPECRADSACHDHAPVREWRHLDTCQFQTIIRARVPRVNCKEHGVRTIGVPWSGPHSRFTLLFEACVIEWLKLTKCQSAVAKQMRISSDQVHAIMRRAVERGLERRVSTPVVHVGIDEKSMKRGHHYLTVVSDLTKGRVLDVAEKRTTEAATTALQSAIPEEHRPVVRAICADMLPAYATAAATVLPGASLVHDRFHISGYLNKAIDQTRRREASALHADGRDDLKGARWPFLKNIEDLTPRQYMLFQEASKIADKTAAVWHSREIFRGFWDQPTAEKATKFLNSWCETAIAKNIPALTAVAKMIAAHATGLVNFIEHRITNAMAENLNGRIQQIKATARGLRNFEIYRIHILFHLGGLDLNPLKTP